ncbi:MAG: pseudouridine synthase [Actinomycetota bacterium]
MTESINPEGEKLQKVLAAAGVASRRAAEQMISAGRVAVNGKPAGLGRRVNPATDEVTLDGRRIQVDPQRRYLAVNKPEGVISTAHDPQGRRTVVDMVGEEERLFPVGRLDAASEGLMLLTNDGELTARLTHPSFGVIKTYVVEVGGILRAKDLSRLRAGIDIEGRAVKVDAVKVLGRQGARGGRTVLEISIHEGRKHIVRRLLDAAGFPVDRLVRTALGSVRLGRLKPGQYRNLTPDEVAALYREVGL